MYHIGTSGWQYADWKNRFYPRDLAVHEELAYYAKHFSSVEINTTFYHLPSADSVRHWHNQVPRDFSFAVKMNRYISQQKKLIIDDVSLPYLTKFLQHTALLKEKLGIILVQLPANFRANPKRLEDFLKNIQKLEKNHKQQFPLAFEFRHESWFEKEITDLLRAHNAVNVVADAKKWPTNSQIIGQHAYFRFHGSKKLYASKYSHRQLTDWQKFIRSHCRSCKEIFIYFNNDHHAFAIQNARQIRKMLDK